MFEAGLFGGVLGMRRTFILHASGAKLPTDLLGLTCVRYAGAMTAAEMRSINQKLRKAIENEGRLARIEGLLVAILADRAHREGAFRAEPAQDLRATATARSSGRALVAARTAAVGALLERGGKEKRSPRASSTTGTASGRWTRTRRSCTAPARSGWNPTTAPPAIGRPDRTRDPEVKARTSGIYWRADPDDLGILDGRDDRKRAALIQRQLRLWKDVRGA